MGLPELGVVGAPLVAAERQPPPVLLEAEPRLGLERERHRRLGRRDPEAWREPRRLQRPELVLVDVAVAEKLPRAPRLTHDPARELARVPAGDEGAGSEASPGFGDGHEGLHAAKRQAAVPDAREEGTAVRGAPHPRRADVVVRLAAPAREVVGEDRRVELVHENELVLLEAAVEPGAQHQPRVVPMRAEVPVVQADADEVEELQVEALRADREAVVAAEVRPEVPQRDRLVRAEPLAEDGNDDRDGGGHGAITSYGSCSVTTFVLSMFPASSSGSSKPRGTTNSSNGGAGSYEAKRPSSCSSQIR